MADDQSIDDVAGSLATRHSPLATDLISIKVL
jgi:hypothetical protein